MDFYEGVVTTYLRANRALFVNTECCIQINEADNPDSSGPHWYCDAVAADFRSKTVFLCEISYGARLSDLTKRLKGWHGNSSSVGDYAALVLFFINPLKLCCSRQARTGIRGQSPETVAIHAEGRIKEMRRSNAEKKGENDENNETDQARDVRARVCCSLVRFRFSGRWLQ
jgi:hypothetical protein